ncbi:hypothetical protein PYW07_016826 [Mythimna separata]|uniref:Coiled-coil domain-containing protein 137 n=1 Tax=Mythimna separata TaxID=271217 RepID=A0AAD7YW10_MYTSE|nr:hypothetical protein PYW07_016826 [Mythimna separata]
MGRKIPAKKHRGVKDPLVQQAKRLASLKGKINAPPKDPDDQPVPKSLTRLFAFRDRHSKKSITKKKNHNGRQQMQGNGPGAPHAVASLRRLAGESGRAFSLRINSAVKALHNPAEQLHYPLDIEAEDEKGLRMDELRARRARKRRRAAAAPGESGEPALTRTQRLALKKKAKKMKVSEASKTRQEVQYERVAFGDVTHAPPALPGRGAAPASRPGRRDLLLTSLLAGGGARAGGAGGAGGGARAGGVCAAELQRRERARLAAVAAYRELKASKLKNK